MVARFLDLVVHRHVIVGYVLSKYFRKYVIMHACINKFKKNFTQMIMMEAFIFDTERCVRKQIQLYLI